MPQELLQLQNKNDLRRRDLRQQTLTAVTGCFDMSVNRFVLSRFIYLARLRYKSKLDTQIICRLNDVHVRLQLWPKLKEVPLELLITNLKNLQRSPQIHLPSRRPFDPF